MVVPRSFPLYRSRLPWKGERGPPDIGYCRLPESSEEKKIEIKVVGNFALKCSAIRPMLWGGGSTRGMIGVPKYTGEDLCSLSGVQSWGVLRCGRCCGGHRGREGFPICRVSDEKKIEIKVVRKMALRSSTMWPMLLGRGGDRGQGLQTGTDFKLQLRLGFYGDTPLEDTLAKSPSSGLATLTWTSFLSFMNWFLKW